MSVQAIQAEGYVRVDKEKESVREGASMGKKLLAAAVIAILLLNVAIMSVLLYELYGARQQANHFATKFSAITDHAEMLGTALEGIDRVIHGSIPNLINDFIQSDYYAFGNNMTVSGNRLRMAAEQTGEYDVAKYASLVSSIGYVVSTVQPRFPSPRPQPTDQAGVLNMLDYITSWVASQGDPAAWQAAGAACVALGTDVLALDWQGTYAFFSQQLHWDANSQVHDVVNKILPYCQAVAAIKPDRLKGPVSAEDAKVDKQSRRKKTEKKNKQQ